VQFASGIRLSARAVGHKLRAVRSLGTFWPAAVRGGKLLARGRLREFAGKLLNETATVLAIDSAPSRTGPPLILAGHILRPGGYDHVVFSLLKGLLEAGIDVHRDPYAVLNLNLIPRHLRPSEGRCPRGTPRLAATPPHLLHRLRPNRDTVAFTMWETDALPAGAVAALNRCRMVIVPSCWGADCFRANGVRVPIEVVPLGYDPEVFSPSPPAMDGPVIFGTAGALDAGGLRKNVQRVIDLFRRAFPTEREVRLRVKITPTSPMVQTHGDSRIEVVQRSLSPVELTAWYQSLTAYVNASFGEGFGLHLLEAMACGRPLISTRFGGVSEFFDESVGYVVGHHLIEARNAVYSGRWADPNDDEIIEQIRRVYRDRQEAARLGEAAAKYARRFTWRDAVRKLMAVCQRENRFTAPLPQ
jgi:glycosyltransferase involved in cell wall biosynthesis